MAEQSTKTEDFCVIYNKLKSLYQMMATESFHVGFALILMASFIAITSLIGIIYHCYMWSRFKSREKEPKKVESQPQSKVYEPIYVKPLVKSLKEYETQVLEMSVPIVDDTTSFEENIYEKIGPKISDYSSRSELKVNDLINGNTCSSTTHSAVNMPKNPLYCEILEESSQRRLSGDRLFNSENIYSTTSREKTTEL